MYAKLLSVTLIALAVVVSTGAPVDAQWSDWRVGRDQGYRDGARAGGDDARDGRSFEYQRHRDYREADGGYRGRDARRDDVTREYRAGFVAGYRDGYYSGGGRGPGRGNVHYATDVAYRTGLDDGYEKGLDDARDRDRADPSRHARYRNDDRGYRREYGPRGLYQEAYRAAFERGYDRGYRDGRGQRGARLGGIIFRW